MAPTTNFENKQSGAYQNTKHCCTKCKSSRREGAKQTKSNYDSTTHGVSKQRGGLFALRSRPCPACGFWKTQPGACTSQPSVVKNGLNPKKDQMIYSICRKGRMRYEMTTSTSGQNIVLKAVFALVQFLAPKYI